MSKTNYWKWCSASNRCISEFSLIDRPEKVDDRHFTCPNCGRVVGYRAVGFGQLLARHMPAAQKNVASPK